MRVRASVGIPPPGARNPNRRAPWSREATSRERCAHACACRVGTWRGRADPTCRLRPWASGGRWALLALPGLRAVLAGLGSSRPRPEGLRSLQAVARSRPQLLTLGAALDWHLGGAAGSGKPASGTVGGTVESRSRAASVLLLSVGRSPRPGPGQPALLGRRP